MMREYGVSASASMFPKFVGYLCAVTVREGLPRTYPGIDIDPPSLTVIGLASGTNSISEESARLSSNTISRTWVSKGYFSRLIFLLNTP